MHVLELRFNVSWEAKWEGMLRSKSWTGIRNLS